MGKGGVFCVYIFDFNANNKKALSHMFIPTFLAVCTVFGLFQNPSYSLPLCQMKPGTL